MKRIYRDQCASSRRHLQTTTKRLSIAEKIGVMEELWNDLSILGAEYSPPDWHGRVLAERKRLAESGEIGFSDWETTKQEIQDRIS